VPKEISHNCVLANAAARGLVRFKVAAIARRAGVSESSVRTWLAGRRVSDATDSALREVLGASQPGGVSTDGR